MSQAPYKAQKAGELKKRTRFEMIDVALHKLHTLGHFCAPPYFREFFFGFKWTLL